MANPYHPVRATQAEPRQYVMRKVAPRRVWPPIVFGWLVSMNTLAVPFVYSSAQTIVFGNFLQNSSPVIIAWHNLHNIICGIGSKLDLYLDIVRDKPKCNVVIFDGRADEVVPVECSYNVQSRIPRARVKVVENKDHITLVVGRQEEFARQLEEIWKTSSC